MDLVTLAMDILFSMDESLLIIVQQYGYLTYPIIFAIVFLETGLVFAPFLPGDSLLFLAGALAAAGALDILVLFAAIATAAIAGDTCNYHIGKYAGRRLLKSGRIDKRYVLKAEGFFARHGGKTIVLARFIPFVRTFAPFVAGMGSMRYRSFVIYNITGGLAWSAALLSLGYLFGNLPIVKDHLSFLFIGIVLLSFAPFGAAFLKKAMRRKQRS